MRRSGAGRTTSPAASPSTPMPDGECGAMIDLRCETAPVANNEQFVRLGQRPGPATWPPVPARPRPRHCWPSRRPAEGHAPRAVRRPEQPHPRGVQARADRARSTARRRLRPSQRRGRRALAIRGRQRRVGPRHLHARCGAMRAICIARNSIRPWWPRSEKFLARPLAPEADKIKAEAERLLACPTSRFKIRTTWSVPRAATAAPAAT